MPCGRDVSILVLIRLQRSEYAALSGLRDANTRLSDAVGQLARFAERRKLYLDGLVRVGISATGGDPAQQMVTVLDETVLLLGGERAFLYLMGADGELIFRAGRNSAGEDVDAAALAADEDVLRLPLTVRDRSLGEIRVERPAHRDVDAAEGEGDFLLALASHAAITITTVESAGAEATRFSVSDLLEGLVEEATPAAEANSNSVELAVDEGVGSVTADRERLATVLRKILDNACKFTHDGRVSIRAHRGEGGETLRFEIADSGIGLDDEQRRRCFEPFWQADDSSTREFEGSGLGLTTAHRLCSSMGGSIEVAGRDEGGSLFVVTVPVGIDR